MRQCLLAFATVAVLVLATVTACGGSASSVSGFGTGGQVRTDFGGDDGVSAIVIQSDGKIVAAGGSGSDFALARYLPDGSLDPGFGTGGKVLTDVGADGSKWTWERGANAVAVQADGRIVAAGAGDGAFALTRYSRDGRPDRSFGRRGTVVTDLSRDDWAGEYATAVTVQPDGKILAAGAGSRMFALARYLPNGSLDPRFGDGGKVLTRIGWNDASFATAVALDDDRDILATGWSGPRGITTAELVRYTSRGTVDRTFGTGGEVTIGPQLGVNTAIAVQADGRIVVAGDRHDPSRYDPVTGSPPRFAVSRYTPSGRLDSTFGSGGHVLTGFSDGGGASAVAIQSDANIIAAGWANAGIALVRYTPNGSLDPSFGTGGKVVTGLSMKQRTSASAVAIQDDGGIVVAADSESRTRGDFVLVRYTPEGELDS